MRKIILIIAASFFAMQTISAKVFLVFGGKTGWIGQQLVTLIEEKGHTATCATARLENRPELLQELEIVRPDFIINAAGITGRPNVDWCEEHRQETIRANVIGALNLADIAHQLNIHLTNVSTGCIYQYDASHPLGSGKGFTEKDDPNFAESFYSYTKILLEKLIIHYPNVLHLRLKMPISDDLNPRGFLGKIIRYKKVVNIPNSVAVLYDLLPLIPEMALRKLTGIYNFVNPGTLSHNQILDLYKKYIDPSFSYQNFTLEEQALVLKAGRSNCELDASKLLTQFPNIPHTHQSIVGMFGRMAAAT